MGKWQKHKKAQRTSEPKGQPFPAGEHKAAMNSQESITYHGSCMGSSGIGMDSVQIKFYLKV